MGKLWNKETLEPTTQSPYNATFSGLERVAKGARRNGTRWRSGPTNATASQRASSVIQLSHLLSWLSLKASDIAILFQIEEDLVSAKIFSVWVQCQAFMSSPMSSILLKCRKPACMQAPCCTEVPWFSSLTSMWPFQAWWMLLFEHQTTIKPNLSRKSTQWWFNTEVSGSWSKKMLQLKKSPCPRALRIIGYNDVLYLASYSRL